MDRDVVISCVVCSRALLVSAGVDVWLGAWTPQGQARRNALKRPLPDWRRSSRQAGHNLKQTDSGRGTRVWIQGH